MAYLEDGELRRLRTRGSRRDPQPKRASRCEQPDASCRRIPARMIEQGRTTAHFMLKEIFEQPAGDRATRSARFVQATTGHITLPDLPFDLAVHPRA